MSRNFKVATKKNGGALQVTLRGDFDGISAHELIDILKKEGTNYPKIYINTANMDELHPFGIDVFQSYFDRLKGSTSEFVFTGENAVRLAPNTASTLGITITTLPTDVGSEKQ